MVRFWAVGRWLCSACVLGFPAVVAALCCVAPLCCAVLCSLLLYCVLPCSAPTPSSTNWLYKPPSPPTICPSQLGRNAVGPINEKAMHTRGHQTVYRLSWIPANLHIFSEIAVFMLKKKPTKNKTC